MDINYTKHALKRMQQRGISKKAIEHILKYGEVFYDGHGAKVFFINKKNRNLENMKKLHDGTYKPRPWAGWPWNREE